MEIPETRDRQFDSIRGLMIFLVVFAHVLSFLYPAWEKSESIKVLYYTVYSFHMPMLIFIAGYFSKGGFNDEYIRKAISRCLVPYLVFQILYGFPIQSFSEFFNLLYPRWTLWFLLSLFFWKIIVKPFSMLRHPVAVIIATALYIGMYNSIGAYLAASRTICLFPFFLAGFLTQKESVAKIRNSGKLIPVGLFLLSLAGICCLTTMNLKTEVLYMSRAYEVMELPILQGVIFRSYMILAGFVGVFFFLSVMPQKETIFTHLGECSITVYLAHSVVIRILKYYQVVQIERPAVFIVFGIVLSLIICLLFGNMKVKTAYQKAMDAISGLILR